MIVYMWVTWKGELNDLDWIDVGEKEVVVFVQCDGGGGNHFSENGIFL